MAIRVRIPAPLRELTQGRVWLTLEMSSGTMDDVLAELGRVHPAVRDRVLTETGEVRPHVQLFVGDESIRFTGGLATAVPDGAEVSIIPAVSGG